MAKQEKAAPEVAKAPANKGGACIAEGCSKSIERDVFCSKHFSWFKLGLITKSGTPAKDFDTKFRQHGAEV